MAILCGVVWGLWIGFAIVAAGTYLGEVGNFYAFKSLCAAHGRKLEQTQISYACLAKIVRERGFVVSIADARELYVKEVLTVLHLSDRRRCSVLCYSWSLYVSTPSVHVLKPYVGPIISMQSQQQCSQHVAWASLSSRSQQSFPFPNNSLQYTSV